jgi:protein-S-isoprenylcysteine O-methyltransferase Ste14
MLPTLTTAIAQPRSHFRKNPHQDGKKFMIIAEVEIARKIVLGIVVMIGVLMFALTDARGANGTLAHEIIQWSGIIAILICILGRTRILSVGIHCISCQSWERAAPGRSSAA